MKLSDEDMPTKRIVSAMESGYGFDISELNWLPAYWSDLDFVIFIREANLFFYSVVTIPMASQEQYLQDIMNRYMELKDAT